MQPRFAGIVSETPHVAALLLCERVIIDRDTGSKSFIDGMTGLVAEKLPARLNRLCIHIALQRGENDTAELGLAMYSPSDIVLTATDIRVTTWGENGEAEFEIILPAFDLQEAGYYEVRVFSGGHLLAQRRLLVQIAPTTPGELPPPPTSAP